MPVQAQVVAADINGDGQTEIVAADTRGNVAAFTPRGKEVWERHLASLIAQVRKLTPAPLCSVVSWDHCEKAVHQASAEKVLSCASSWHAVSTCKQPH